MDLQKNQHQKNVLKAINYIEDNLKQPIHVNDVCTQIAMSPWQFQRVFRFLVGSPIGFYLRGRRLTEAYKYLVEKELKIVELAFDFQFGSHEAFSRSFKNFFGCSPNEARHHKNDCSPKCLPRLDLSKLDVVWGSIQKISEKISVQQLNLVGLAENVPSPFSADAEFENKTQLVWNSFWSELKNPAIVKTNLFSGLAHGVSMNSKDNLIADQMLYFASKSRDEFATTPHAFTEFTLPPGDFVSFSIVGNLQQIKTLVDYIYAIWLPASEFKRTSNFDFETFNFSANSDRMKYHYTYNLPVEPR